MSLPSPAAPTPTGDEAPVKWVRACNTFELIMDKLQSSWGIMITCYCLSVNSAAPLKKEHVEQALRHLYRTVPSLRLSIRPRGDHMAPWTAEMDKEDIDFEVIPEEDLELTIQKFKETSFPSITGPLWRVRMTSGAETNSANFDLKQIPAGFKFEHKILLSLHHAITDGFSTSRICGHFINFLDDVVCGRPIDDSVQVAEFADGDKFSSEDQGKILKMFEEDPKQYDRALEEYDDFQKKKLLLTDAYPVRNKEVSDQTLLLRNDFDRETTKKFLAKCKSNGVSFHTGFFTAVQVAVTELLKDAGIIQKNYDISSSHVVNSRRFWNKDVDREVQFGSNIAALPVSFSVPSDWRGQFWTVVCQHHHLLFMSRLNNSKAQLNEICRIERMKPMMAMLMGTKEGEKISIDIPPTMDFDTNNMGDITAMLSGDVPKSKNGTGARVFISDILRTTSTHGGGIVCAHVTQTLRGRLLHSMDYNIHHMDTATAKKYLQKVTEVVKIVIDL